MPPNVNIYKTSTMGCKRFNDPTIRFAQRVHQHSLIFTLQKLYSATTQHRHHRCYCSQNCTPSPPVPRRVLVNESFFLHITSQVQTLLTCIPVLKFESRITHHVFHTGFQIMYFSAFSFQFAFIFGVKNHRTVTFIVSAIQGT